MPYDSYRLVGYSETKIGYNIMRDTYTSIKYLLDSVQVFISWPMVCEV
jgi:hypothetical protein